MRASPAVPARRSLGTSKGSGPAVGARPLTSAVAAVVARPCSALAAGPERALRALHERRPHPGQAKATTSAGWFVALSPRRAVQRGEVSLLCERLTVFERLLEVLPKVLGVLASDADA